MKYLWTEDTGAGLHFWKLVNQLFFENVLVIESKESNQDIRNKYRLLKKIEAGSDGKIQILDMICFEYIILAFENLVIWTGTGKKDKIKIRDEKTLQYLSGFKRYSTERVMKSLVSEFTQNEKWSIKGTFMGACWYKDCCISDYPDNLRCGKPEVEKGDEKMRLLIQSEEVQKLIRDIAND